MSSNCPYGYSEDCDDCEHGHGLNGAGACEEFGGGSCDGVCDCCEDVHCDNHPRNSV